MQYVAELILKVLWLFGLIALAALFTHLWSGDHLTLGRYTGYLMPWFLAILIPGVAWSLWNCHWYLATVLGVSLGIVLSAHAPLLLPRHNVVNASSSELKVISFNVWSENSSPGRIAEVVSDHGPDILLLQEITPLQFETLSRALDEISKSTGEKWSKVYEPALLQAVVSRYQLRRHWVNEDKANVQVVSAEAPFGTVMLFNVHPPWGNWERRDRQLSDLLKNDILTCEMPAILGGDFNTTDQSEIFGLLVEHLHNAHWDACKGFGFSFPRALYMKERHIPFFPFMRIDHIFFSDQFVALDAATLADAYGSDHLPVTARLALKSGLVEKDVSRR